MSEAMTARDLVAALVGESNQRDATLAAELAAWAHGYEAGHAAGYQAGLEDGHQAADASWADALRPAQVAARRTARGPSYAELERRRVPRPGGFEGGPAAVERVRAEWERWAADLRQAGAA